MKMAKSILMAAISIALVFTLSGCASTAAKQEAAYAASERGEKAFGESNYDKALAEYNEAIWLNPNYIKAYERKGYILEFIEKDYDKAIANYNEAIRHNPNEAGFHWQKGSLYFWKKNDYDKAIANYSEAIRLEPKGAVYFVERGRAYFEKRDYDKAFADYGKAVQLDTTDFSYYRRGEAYFEKGDFNKAIEDYTEAIRLTSKKPAHFEKSAYFSRGKAYYEIKDYNKAAADINTALKIKSDEYFNENEAESLLAELQNEHNVLAEEPSKAAFYAGKKAAEAKEHDKAIAEFTKAIQLKPNKPEYYRNRGDVYSIWKNDYDKAIADYTQAIRLEPNSSHNYSNRADAYLKKKDYDKAIADYDKAIQLNASSDFYYYLRANAYFEKRDYDNAVDDYDQAIRIKPKDFYHNARQKAIEKGGRSYAQRHPSTTTYSSEPAQEQRQQQAYEQQQAQMQQQMQVQQAQMQLQAVSQQLMMQSQMLMNKGTARPGQKAQPYQQQATGSGGSSYSSQPPAKTEKAICGDYAAYKRMDMAYEGHADRLDNMKRDKKKYNDRDRQNAQSSMRSVREQWNAHGCGNKITKKSIEDWNGK